MKIAFFEFEQWEKEFMSFQLKDHQVSFFPDALGSHNVQLAKDAEIISCFTGSDASENVLRQMPNLKMITTRSTGFDHINLDYCKQKNITVCNVPTYGENTVAEHTFALILTLSRKVTDSIERTRRGDFSLDGLRGFDLKGKTIGIVGMGHIGQHVARMANGFEMNVLGFDMYPDKKLAKNLNFTYAAFDELLEKSDIISFHVPYNKNTHHLINVGNINLIKKGAYIINTSRGGVIETDALVQALTQGIIAGAGLDVLEEENFIKEESDLLSKEFHKQHDLKTIMQDHILLDQKNVIITPHNAFNSNEAMNRIAETTVENIEGFVKG
ncbi:MAG: hydroxyacid dehydrogenase, partial [Candidatus Paceibacterales bacterium]